jgi:hypothetical protein
MKTYLDLLDTKLKLDIKLELVGSPDFLLTVKSGDSDMSGQQDLNQSYEIDLLTPFSLSIILRNKNDNNTAIIIRRISVDNIEIMPRFNYLADYINEHNTNTPTSYLGVNGKWTLTINRPFYQWLHQATGQGWLIG